MDAMVLRMFLRELEGQCRQALLAAQDMDRYASDRADGFVLMRSNGPLGQQRIQEADDRFWYSCQMFHASVANISKILFPTRTGDQVRGETLRATCGIAADSAFNADGRAMRNNYEHMDERLDTWASTSPNRNFMDRNIEPVEQSRRRAARQNLFRTYDDRSRVLTFMDTEYELEPVQRALTQLRDRVIAETAAL